MLLSLFVCLLEKEFRLCYSQKNVQVRLVSGYLLTIRYAMIKILHSLILYFYYEAKFSDRQ